MSIVRSFWFSGQRSSCQGGRGHAGLGQGITDHGAPGSLAQASCRPNNVPPPSKAGPSKAGPSKAGPGLAGPSDIWPSMIRAPATMAVVALAAAVAAGCSTDVSRFDMPVFGVSEGATAPPPLPPPRGRSGVGGPTSNGGDENFVRPIPRDGGGRGASSGGGVAVANLPDAPGQAKIPADVAPIRRAAGPNRTTWY